MSFELSEPMRESETVELKKSLSELKRGLISMVAILNKHGAGELWFGVAPGGSVVGLDANEKTLRDVSQTIGAHIEPRIYPHIELARLNGKSCLHIINAFCHRDYRDPDYIHVAIFKNRVEIRNPGGLYDGLAMEEMRQGNVSRRRNDLFRRIQMVEGWGRGMPLIFENAPTVQFRQIAGLFIASFERPSFLEGMNQVTDEY